MNTKAKKGIKIACIVLACLFGAFVLLVGGYVTYVAAQYYRIKDNTVLDIGGNATATVRIDETYGILTYNLGFGAYSPEYSFFMDTGVMNDGTRVTGKYAKGLSKADVEKNITGQISIAQAQNADFCFFQEVDKKADRSYNIAMRDRILQAMDGYQSTYALNFHTANLLYPFGDPIGKSTSGLLTFSRCTVEDATRRSFPVTTAFIDKLFDLDRCFAVHRLPIEGSDKKLVLIHLHMSAYDKGGTIRARQLRMLNDVLSSEREAGNYVIAGGDFNHCLIADNFASDEEALQYFESDQRTPDWVKNSVLHASELAEGFSIAAPVNAATCRGAEMPYTPDINYSTVIDGFLISDNIVLEEILTVDTQYAYSDHNPVRMEFRLL